MRSHVSEFLIAIRLLSEVAFRCRSESCSWFKDERIVLQCDQLFYICTKTGINHTVREYRAVIGRLSELLIRTIFASTLIFCFHVDFLFLNAKFALFL